MNKVAVSCDLDDTIMPNHFNYEKAKDNVCNIILDHNNNLDKEDILEKINEFDMKRHRKNGITKTRFANSLVDCVDYFIKDCSENIRNKAYSEGMRPIKSPEEYNKVGTYDGWPEFAEVMNDVSDYTVLITVGVRDVQNNKISGLGLKSHFNSVHIVDSGGKQNPLSDLSDKYDKVVHVGNSLQSDIKPADDADVDAIHIKNSDWLGDYEPSDSMNLWEANSLIEASRILRENYTI